MRKLLVVHSYPPLVVAVVVEPHSGGVERKNTCGQILQGCLPASISTCPVIDVVLLLSPARGPLEAIHLYIQF